MVPVNAAPINMANQLDDSQTKLIIAHLKRHLSPEDLQNCTQAFGDWQKAFEDPNLRIEGLTVKNSQDNARLKRTFYWFNWQSNAANHNWFLNDFHDFDRVLQPELIAMIMPNLQRLTIDFWRPADPKSVVNDVGEPNTNLINSISDMTKLQHLQIRKLFANRLRTAIRHPKLKYLEISQYVGSVRLKLATPELIGFKTNSDVTLFDFADAPRIRQLSVKYFQSELFITFAHFDLTHIWCKRLHDQTSRTIHMAGQIPTKFRYLEELHFRDQIHAKVAEEFLIEREKLFMNNATIVFKFFYAGIQIDWIDELIAFAAAPQANATTITEHDLVYTPEHFHLILKNYLGLAPNLPFTNYVRYNELDRFARGLYSMTLDPASDRFHNHWLNIRDLTVEAQVKNPDALVDFMKKCKNLSRLDIAHLDQRVLVQLPVFFPLLKCLIIRQSVKLDFVRNFSSLLKISFCYEEALPTISDVFRHMPALESSRFLNSGDWIAVTRLEPDLFLIRADELGVEMKLSRQAMIVKFAVNTLLNFSAALREKYEIKQVQPMELV